MSRPARPIARVRAVEHQLSETAVRHLERRLSPVTLVVERERGVAERRQPDGSPFDMVVEPRPFMGDQDGRPVAALVVVDGERTDHPATVGLVLDLFDAHPVLLLLNLPASGNLGLQNGARADRTPGAAAAARA